MKKSALVLFSIIAFSCASKEPVAQNFTHQDLRSIASDDVQSLSQLTNRQLIAYSGKNILRVIVSCPLSAMTIVASAIAETFPISTSMAGQITELSSYKGYQAGFEWTNKPASTAVGGSVVAVVKDLTTLGYSFVFDDSTDYQDVFKDTKTSYDGTAYLAKKFYSEKGNCGLAGQQLYGVLQEIQNRKK